MIPGVHIPLRSMLVRTARDAILVSPVGTTSELAIPGRMPLTLVAPSLLHHKFLPHAQKAFPDAALWGPPGFADKLPAYAKAKTFDIDPWPFTATLPYVVIDGAPKRNEVVFFHPPSRTLYTADLVFNIRTGAGLLSPLAFRAMGIYRRFAVAKMWKRWVKDVRAFRRSIDALLAWDFDRIAMAHGEIVTSNGRALLLDALRERGLI